MAKFVKGKSGNPAGRPKGTPNKITGDMRAEVWKVFNALQDNGTSLFDRARANPEWFYTVFGARMLPKDLNVRTITCLDDLTEDEKIALAQDLEKGIGDA